MITEIGDHDELLEKVLGAHAGEPLLLDVVGGDEYVLGPEVQVGGGEGPDPSVRFAGEGGSLIVRGGRADHLVTLEWSGLGEWWWC